MTNDNISCCLLGEPRVVQSCANRLSILSSGAQCLGSHVILWLSFDVQQAEFSFTTIKTRNRYRGHRSFFSLAATYTDRYHFTRLRRVSDSR